MSTLLIIYIIGAAITVAHDALKRGKEQARLKAVEPTSFAVTNFTNALMMTPIWFAYWVSLYGRYLVRDETRMEAADGLGIPRDRLVQ